MSYQNKIQHLVQTGRLPEKVAFMLRVFFDSYYRALSEAEGDLAAAERLFSLHLDFVAEQVESPYRFPPFHEAVRSPFDYHSFALEWVEHLLNKSESTLRGTERFEAAEAQLRAGENVVFFSNHQTEPDPQIVTLLLQERFPLIAQSLIFVAGHKVTHDPMSIPYSLGHNLLCIYSKRHIENPPERKAEKQEHNRKTMKRMLELFDEGGRCIWVAPSGGRDRPDAEGLVQIAPFDAQAQEMFYLMTRQSKRPCHVYPLALWTYPLLPPPDRVERELGEQRLASFSPAHLALAPEVDWSQLRFADETNRRRQRELRAEALHQAVLKEYEGICAEFDQPRTHSLDA